MTTRTRMNVYFDPDLLQQVEMLALPRNVSKSAIVEASVASFLSGDTADRLEAAMSRRLDRLGRQMDGLDEDLTVLGETLSLFVQFWLTITPPISDTAQS
ncbi:MAG: CopG family transcriptional regulator, partial [Hyphomonas sp.]|uniref:ribbon-helix-helix domain-containing protein n=1 Tax=Hyphomonas sp. TaxID=87 RepID=UPI00329A418D